MKHLILGKIPDNYNDHSDIVLSAASFLGNEDKIPSNLTFLETFETYKNKKDAALEATSLANYHLLDFSNYLNKKYNLSKNENFWKPIILPWLLTLTHIMLDRYYRIQYCVKTYEKENLTVDLIEKNNKIEIFDTDHLGIFFQDHLANQWIYSFFLMKVLPENWNGSIKKEEIQTQNKYKKTKLSFKRKLVEEVKKKLRVTHVYGFSGLESILFSLYLFLLPSKKSTIKSAIQDNKFPTDFPEYFMSNDFKELALELLPASFQDVSSLLKINLKFTKGKIRILGPIFYSDLYYQVLAARAEEKGEILFSTQHGGGYGRFKVIDYPHQLETQFNGFISWGWKSNSSFPGNIIPLPSPFLSKKFNTHKRKNDEIILVGTKCNPYSDRIEFSFEPSTMLEYRAMKSRFIKLLSNNVKMNFYYRPYPNSLFYFKDFAFQKKHFTDLKELTGDFHKRMKECKLLVLDHAQTTLNLSMAANVPTVCLLIDKDWEASESALDSMNNLRKAGIVYSDPAELAQFINKNFDQNKIEEWWNSNEVQRVRLEWLNTHGKISKYWYFKWLRMLWSYKL